MGCPVGKPATARWGVPAPDPWLERWVGEKASSSDEEAEKKTRTKKEKRKEREKERRAQQEEAYRVYKEQQLARERESDLMVLFPVRRENATGRRQLLDEYAPG